MGSLPSFRFIAFETEHLGHFISSAKFYRPVALFPKGTLIRVFNDSKLSFANNLLNHIALNINQIQTC
jgi:hypothetical protein